MRLSTNICMRTRNVTGKVVDPILRANPRTTPVVSMRKIINRVIDYHNPDVLVLVELMESSYESFSRDII